METAEINNINEQNPAPKRRLGKGWRIALISAGSLIAFLIVVVVVALWLVLTPARLTSIVNKLSDKYILCDNHFERVDLTLFKTFPYVGLTVENVTLVNPLDGAPNDTLARIGELSVGFNVREYLKNSNIEVTKLVLDNVCANLYTDADGRANFDIFPHSDTEDTVSKPFEIPELVSLKSIRVKRLDADYVDRASGVCGNVADFTLSVDGRYANEELRLATEAKIDKLLLALRSDSSDITAQFGDVTLTVGGDAEDGVASGRFSLVVNDGSVAIGGEQYVNEALAARDGALLSVEGVISGRLEDYIFDIEKVTARLKDYELGLQGTVAMPLDYRPLTVNMEYSTNEWDVAALLAMLPAGLTEWQKGMAVGAAVTLRGMVDGSLTEGRVPQVTADILLKDGHFCDRSIAPYAFNGITADIGVELDLSKDSMSDVTIRKLTARTGRNNVELSGHVADLMGRMQTDATVRGTLYLGDLRPLLPDDLALLMDGKARLNLKASTDIEQLQKSDFANMRLSGDVAFTDLDVVFDTISAKVPDANINVQLPSTRKGGLFDELLSATVTASGIAADMPNSNISGTLGKTRLAVALNDIFDTTQPFKVLCDFDFETVDGAVDSIRATLNAPKGTFAMVPLSKESDKVDYSLVFNSDALHCDLGDSMTVDLAGMTVKGGASYDPSRPNALQQWSPNLDVDFKRGYIDLEQMAYIVQIPDMKFNYKPEICEIANANVVFGNSDIYLSGAVTGLEKWLSHEGMLKGDLYLTSNYTNVDDLLDAFSGMGSDVDTLEAQRKEDNVDTSANPFIVPRDVDFTLHTRIKEATAFDNDLSEVAGNVQIRDGVAVLNQVGFVCKAARMQLTGMYRTPRVNHIFVGMDFHLLDINIQELIEMIPYVDTLVPLLNDLEGRADFHLCAETYVDAFYKPKMSTLRGAAALTGQDLVVLDNKDIDRIAKLLQLKQWREDDSKIHVDSLDVAMTVFRNELEVYPFLLSLHKYQIVAEGRHNLSNNYDYHVELVQSPLPVRLAVDVFGTLPNLKFGVSPSLRYKNLYRPAKRDDVDKETLRLKAMIRQSLEANVKEDTRTYEGLKEDED